MVCVSYGVKLIILSLEIRIIDSIGTKVFALKKITLCSNQCY